MGDLIEGVYRRGERFSSWDEMFDFERWMSELRIQGIDENRYLSFDRNLDRLPWHFIDCRVSRNYLQDELERARRKVATENCLFGACSSCGVCDDVIRNRPAAESGVKPRVKTSTFKRAGGAHRSRMLFSFTKTGVLRYIGHLDLITLLVRLGRIAGIPFLYSEGFNPKPRLSLPFPLPLGVSSRYELGEVTLEGHVTGEAFREMMNRAAREGLKILAAVPNHRKGSIASKPHFHDYVVRWKEGVSRERIIESLRDVGPHHGKDDAPRSFYDARDPGLFVRLEGNMSVKKLFNDGGEGSYADHDIERVMIWKTGENGLVPFIG